MFSLVLTAALAIAPAGHADVVCVEPRIVVVEKDGTPMRCASGMPFYAVNMLPVGQKLRVDGEEGEWLRVEYLTDMLAFAKAEDAQLEPDGKSIRLIRPSRLAAVNDHDNERGHWWCLLDTPLPADASLRVHQVVKAMNEVTTGYLVVAPAQSRGFVKADSVRTATRDEQMAFQGRTDVEAPQFAAVLAKDADAFSVSADALPSAEVIHDIDTLKARHAQIMALKDDEASKQIPAVIAEFKRTAASLGSSNEDRRLKHAIDWSIRVLQLRHDILSTLKTFPQERTAASNTSAVNDDRPVAAP